MAAQPQSDPWAEAAKNYKPTATSGVAPQNEDWKVWETGAPGKSNGFFEGIQQSFDKNTKTNPNEPLLQTGLKSITGAIGSPFMHPVQTAKSFLNMIPSNPDISGPTHQPDNPLVERGIQVGRDIREGGLPYAATKLGGETLGGMALGGAVKGIVGVGGVNSIREAALGDQNVAALKGLQVGPKSPKTLSTLKSVEGARPFLQGANSLEDLQAKIGPAKQEIWSQYQQAIDAIGNRSVKGPDGMTTVKALEDERAQLSALNRGIKQQLPEALQLAQQKGLTASQLLARERAVQSALDPELASTGINPQQIRQSFGQVSQIGSRVSGKSTLAEQAQPSGFGKLAKFDLTQPLQTIPQIGSGIRDLVAGRPLFSAKPTDLGIREGFRNAGPKPDFGVLTPPDLSSRIPPRLMAPLQNIELGTPSSRQGSGGGLFRANKVYQEPLYSESSLSDDPKFNEQYLTSVGEQLTGKALRSGRYTPRGVLRTRDPKIIDANR
jgi:hypothetical protein